MPTINTKAYSQKRALPDLVTYAGPNDTLSVLDQLECGRVLPKPGKNDPGVARPKAALRWNYVDAAGVTREANLALTGSLPVGVDLTVVGTKITDLCTFVQSTEGLDLFKKLDINA